MPAKVSKTLRDGLLVTSVVSSYGVYTASQLNFLQALAGLRQVLTLEEYEKFLQTPIPDQSSNGIMELSQGICEERSKRRFQRLSSHFERFLQSILRFSALIDTFVSSNPAAAALVWGGVKFVITSALNYLTYFEQISKVFQRLGDLCPFFEEFVRLLPESDRLRESLADFYAVSIRFCTEALEFLKKPAFEQVTKAMWKPFDVSFQDIDAELSRQQEIIDREIRLASEAAAYRARQEASLYQHAGNQHHLETYAYQDEGRQHRQKIALYQDEQRQHHSTQMIHLAKIENLSVRQYVDERETRHKVLLTAISEYNHKHSFSNACDKRLKDTGLWLFEVPELKEWSQKQKSCGLWCYGIPGAGKTILTAGAIEHLFLHYQSPQVTISYLFCEFATEESTQLRTILRSLIKQILSVFDPKRLSLEMEKGLRAMFLGSHREPKSEELYQVLLSVAQLATTTYLVIDGLDECKFDDRNRLLSYLKELIRPENNKSRIKIIISSRAKVDISRSLKSFYHISLDSARTHRSDIESYVREMIDEKLREEVLRVGDPSMAEEIKEALIRGSDGMFLWAEFQIFEICRENNDNDIRRVLRSLPKGLDGIYTRILERIVANHRPDVAKKVFTWLAVGRRPLSLDELNEAVAFAPGCLRWDQGSFQNDALNMLRNCGNLVNQKDGIVQFAHYTVLEFLVSGRVTAEFFFRKREANLYVGKICMMYLNFPDFITQISSIAKGRAIPAPAGWIKSMEQQDSLAKWFLKIHPRRRVIDRATPTIAIDTQTLQRTRDPDSQLQESLKKFCLLGYVAKNWISHCSELSKDDTENWDLFNNLVFHRTLPFNHVPWPHPDSNTSEFYFKTFMWASEADNSALLRTAYDALDENLSGPTYIEARDAAGQTPIQLASSRGNELVLEDLIAFGANINAQPSESGRTALQAAAGGGHLNVVNRLITVNADVNAGPADSGGQTALQAAAESGHIDIVNRLIEAKANVNAEPAGDHGRTALQAAAESGHMDIVNRLIEAKANVNAEPAGDHGRTALQAAAESGHMDIVNRLIAVNADVNAGPADSGGRMALQAAAESGHLDIVNRLIEAKADVNARFNGRTALQAAAESGHLNTVNLLIEVNANVNAGPSEDRGRTALQAAAESGHLDIVNRLIEAKANVNAGPAGDHGRTALQAAAESSHMDIVNRLIEAGADVNAGPAGYHGQTALQAAAEGGHMDIVNRLIEAKADVNAGPAGDCGRTALQAAAESGHMDIVNRLMEAKANTNAEPARDYRRTVLQAAAGSGHTDIVNRLIEAKANVNEEPAGFFGRTALQAAAEGGHLGVVNRLIEANANVNARPAGRYGRTALQAAAESSHIDIVNRLIEAKADVNAEPARFFGRTALQAAAEGGHMDIVNRLIEAKANVNARPVGDCGWTALQAAAESSYMDIVNRLIEAKANVDAEPGYSGRTALQAAAERGHLDIVERLRNAGAKE